MKPSSGKSVGWHETFTTFFIVTIFSLGYAIVRYNIIREVPFENVPLYISNKAIAMAATILIGISFVMGPLARFSQGIVRHLYLRKHVGLVGFALAAMHTLMSMILLGPAYYSRLYLASGKLTLVGESAMLFGVLAIVVFSIVSITSMPPIFKHMDFKQWQFVQRLGYLAYIFVMLHVYVMAYKGWSNPDAYSYGFIPVSLLSVLVIVFVLLMRVLVMALPNKYRK